MNKTIRQHTFLIFAALVFALTTGLSAAASIPDITRKFADESLNYKVMFKWGLVHKQAGRATLSIRTVSDRYHAKLTARSESWADRFFRVRDTLEGQIIRETFRPVLYKKLAHEGDEYKRDVVRYVYSGNRIIGECTRKKWDKKGTLKVNEERTLEANGTTVDMLSSFYYMRGLPYEDWEPGHVVALNIYSGKRKELLTIKYLGIATIETNKKKYQTYHIQFTFTGEGKKKTSDDMDAWISTGEARIPIKLEGKLKVGKVQCFYTGSNN